MGLIYKESDEIEYSVEVNQFSNDRINLIFSCDGGKFGADEILAEFDLEIIDLLDILQKNSEDK